MKQVYDVLTQIGYIAISEEYGRMCNQITFGDIFEVDLQKQNIYPLCHVGIESATFTGDRLNIVEVAISIIVMDLVDFEKDTDRRVQAASTDNWFRMSSVNIVDVLNNTLAIQNRIASNFKRGYAHTQQVQLVDDSVQLTPFVEQYENNLAGWTMTLNIQMPNTEVKLCANEQG